MNTDGGPPGDDKRLEAGGARDEGAGTDNDTGKRPATLPVPATTPEPAREGRRGWIGPIAVAALVTGICGIAAGYLAYWHLLGVHQKSEQHLTQVETSLGVLQQRSGAADARMLRLESEQGVIAKDLAQLEQQQERNALLRVEPADVERLLLMANDSLLLQADVGTALVALRGADQRLRAQGDPLFAEVRRRLAQEITALEAVPRPDIAGMAYTLASLQEELGTLLLSHEAPVRVGTDSAPGPPANPDLPRWRAVLLDIWDSLKGLVVVRHRAGGELPLIAPEQQEFLTQNLYLKLASARLALLSRDNRNFHASLGTAQAWLKQYYDTGTHAVSAVLGRLAELDRVDIRPPLPEINASLDALRAALEHRRNTAQGRSPRSSTGVPAAMGRGGGP